MKDFALSIFLSATIHTLLLFVPSGFDRPAIGRVAKLRTRALFYRVRQSSKKKEVARKSDRERKREPIKKSRKKIRAKKPIRRAVKKSKSELAAHTPSEEEMPLPASAYQMRRTRRVRTTLEGQDNVTRVQKPSSDEVLLIVQFISNVLSKSLSYPQRARRKRQTGKVVLSFVLKPSGEVSHLRLAESSGHRLLDRAALRTVSSCSPFAMRANHDVPEVGMKLLLPITFSLGKE